MSSQSTFDSHNSTETKTVECFPALSLEIIPDLLSFLSEPSPLRSDSEKSGNIFLNDLNADGTSTNEISVRFFPSEIVLMDQQPPPGQLIFNELAIHSPRTETLQSSEFFNIAVVCDLPRCRSTSSNASSQHQANFYEPTRRLPSSAPAPPPKRFFKYWWRGIVRAVYDAKRAEQIATVARSIAALNP